MRIEHKDGRRYEVALADFTKVKAHRNPKTGEYETYADAGFKIAAYADGSPYEGEHAAPKVKDPEPVDRTVHATTEPTPPPIPIPPPLDRDVDESTIAAPDLAVAEKDS